MKYLILALLCGLPFGNFIFNKLNIWLAQGMFFQAGMLLLFCWSFFENPKRINKQNYPLGAFTLWAGIITVFYWYITLITHKQYATIIFFPFFNFLCFLLFYKLTTSYLTKKDVERILFGISISVSIVILYCLLQHFNLDQFYVGLGMPKGQIGNDTIVGTIGNTHHLAGYLAICSPLFFKKGWFSITSLILLWVIIILTASATGLVVSIGVLSFWLFFKKKHISLLIVLGLCVLIAYLYRERLPVFFQSSYRLEAWKMLFEKFRERPVTGFGMGILNAWRLNLGSRGGPETIWNHAHFEYFQIAIELGVIGLGIVIWGIIDYFKRLMSNITDLNIQLASIFFGFIILCFTSYPCHLWLPASMGMVSYSFISTSNQ